MLEQTLDHLQALVSFDTRNPPRAITTGGIFDYLRANLPGFNVEVIDHGAGAVSLYAVRGTPKYLFNVHLDTVPDSPHWWPQPMPATVTQPSCSPAMKKPTIRAASLRSWPVACRMKRCWWPSRP